MAKIDVGKILSTATAVTAALNEAANDPKLSLDKKDVPKVTVAVENAMKDDVKALQKEVDARIDHLTNNEGAWYQKRSFWSAIVSTGMVVLGPLLARYGLPIDPAWSDFVTTALTTVGGLWAAYLAVRAGTASKPLGE
jgi:hypothetical protein